MTNALAQTIQAVNKCMHDYGDPLRKNEWLTRYALIDPVLRAIGWDLTDPLQVEPEYRAQRSERNAVDYLLKYDKQEVVLIEAKRLDKNLSPFLNSLEDKYVSKCRQEHSVAYACLTNGDIWKVYDPNNQYHQVLEISLTSDATEESARKLRAFYGLDFQSVPSRSKEHNPRGRLQLTSIEPRDSLCKPRTILFSDGSEKNVRIWKDVLEATYSWLGVERPDGYNPRDRLNSGLRLKDTARLLYSRGQDPSQVHLDFSQH